MGNQTPRQKADVNLRIAAAAAAAAVAPAVSLAPALQATLATAAQGAMAESALQDSAAFATAAQGAAADAFRLRAEGFATEAQGEAADEALAAIPKFGLWELRATAGTAGGAFSAASAYRGLTTEVYDGVSGSISSGGVLLPAGTYIVSAWAAAGTSTTSTLLVEVNGAVALQGPMLTAPGVARVSGVVTLAAAGTLKLLQFLGAFGNSNDGGLAVNGLSSSGLSETHASLSVWRI